MSEVQHNPKHIQAQKEGKAPLEYTIYSMMVVDARALKHGADKYGVRNWRLDKVLASTYEGAILRHFTAWASGEDIDPDSGQPHLAHIRACCAIIYDAMQHGTLIDDRGRMESKRDSVVGLGPGSILPDEAWPSILTEPVGWPSPRCPFCQTQPCSCSFSNNRRYQK